MKKILLIFLILYSHVQIALADAPSGCSAIGAATYDSGVNTITLNSGTSTLCTIYYDVNNQNVLNYDSATNRYTLNANILVNGYSILLIENTILQLNSAAEDALKITLGKQYYGNGDLIVRASTIRSVSNTKRGSIYATSATGGKGTFNIENSRISYLYEVSVGSGATGYINDSIIDHILYARNMNYYSVTNSTFEFFDTPWGDGMLYGVGPINKVTVRNNIVSGAYGTFYTSDVKDSKVYNLDVGINSAIGVKEQSGSGTISGNIIYNITGSGTGIDAWLSPVYTYEDTEPFIITNNTIDGIPSGKGVQLYGNIWSNVINNTVTNVNTGIVFRDINNKILLKNNNFSDNNYGLIYSSNTNADVVSINDDFSNSTTYDLQLVSSPTPKFINAKYSVSKLSLSGTDRFYDYKYLDVKVIDSNGNPINGAQLTVTNNIDAGYPSINIEGNSKNIFTTGVDGHTPLPLNTLNSAAILDFWKTSSNQQEMTYTITASYKSYTGSTTVAPNSTWYRPNPNTYSNTIIITLPGSVVTPVPTPTPVPTQTPIPQAIPTPNPSPTPTVTPTPTPTPSPTPTPTPTATPTPTLTQVPGAIYDNRLREISPDTVLEGNYFMDLGQISGTGRYRDVLWYDLRQYNKTDKINNAALSLFWFYPSLARNQNTTIEIYRPLTWDPTFVTWNNRTYNTPWNNPGGNWFDRNNAAQGNVPFASITFNANSLPDNKYYAFNVTELVQNYVAGTYNNTGFFLKAKDENDNYIAFYSSDWSNVSQRPRLDISYTTGTLMPTPTAIPSPTPTPTPIYSPSDVNLDGVVDSSDLVIIAQHYGEVTTITPQRYDVNTDGIVDISDLTIVANKIQ